MGQYQHHKATLKKRHHKATLKKRHHNWTYSFEKNTITKVETDRGKLQEKQVDYCS